MIAAEISLLRPPRPADPQLKKQTARVFRFTANVHRLENQTVRALPLYLESLRLSRELATESDEQREFLAYLLRDLASLQANMGHLADAAKSVSEAVAILQDLLGRSPENARVKRGLVAALLGRARVEHAYDQFAKAVQTAQLAEGLAAGIIDSVPAWQVEPYDPLMRAAAFNIAAVNERESGNLKRAQELHRQAVDILMKMQDKPRAGLNNNDVIFFLVRCGVEECQTLARIPETRSRVTGKLNDLSESAIQLSIAFPTIPMYRQLLTDLWRVRARMHTELGKAASARADLENAQLVQSALVADFPQIPGYRADLAETQMELGKLARAAQDKGKSDEWFNRAIANLQLAAQSSPANWAIQRSLDHARAESQK
jgi:tetratricopeptide (TPR) repeat protein